VLRGLSFSIAPGERVGVGALAFPFLFGLSAFAEQQDTQWAALEAAKVP
jgi:hypothetical protein